MEVEGAKLRATGDVHMGLFRRSFLAIDFKGSREHAPDKPGTSPAAVIFCLEEKFRCPFIRGGCCFEITILRDYQWHYPISITSTSIVENEDQRYKFSTNDTVASGPESQRAARLNSDE